MRLSKKTVALLIVAAGAVGAFWIYSSREEYALVTSDIPSQGPVVKVRTNPALGQYQTHLTDPNGFTLYISLGECSGQCLDDWIPYLVNPDIPIDAQDPVLRKLGTIQLFFNEAGQPTYRQYTFLGHPLYYYKRDRNAGDINGHNIADGNWAAALLGAETK